MLKFDLNAKLQEFVVDTKGRPKNNSQGTRQDSLICMPCIVEMLEDTEELVVKKKFALGELLQLMGSNNKMLLDMLADNQRLTWHIVETLHELLEIHREDSAITDVIIELLVQLCCQLECEELVCCLLQHISVQLPIDVYYVSNDFITMSSHEPINQLEKVFLVLYFRRWIKL
ncbi:uncharacterized protein [Amphiura filiformis]|uniref:uncharacterized protein n=1 Tax=Amphiura filiformis TaxID=82378 RepID=UPI003B20C9F8